MQTTTNLHSDKSVYFNILFRFRFPYWSLTPQQQPASYSGGDDDDDDNDDDEMSVSLVEVTGAPGGNHPDFHMSVCGILLSCRIDSYLTDERALHVL